MKISKIAFEKPLLNRNKQDIQSWLAGWLQAENRTNARRTRLIDVYEMLMIDGHLSAMIANRKAKVLGENFSLYDAAGKKDEKYLHFFKKSWFSDFIGHCLDARFFGFSLIELSELSNVAGVSELSKITLIERRNVLVERQELVLKFTDTVGTPFLSPTYKNYYILIDGGEGLGLLLKAAPSVLYKRFAGASWSVFLEKFGMPIIVAHTDRSADEKEAIANDLQSLAREGTIAIGKDETVTMEFPAGNGDASGNFKAMISWCNEEISKLIHGQTMTADNGSSKAQGTVHENTANEIQEADMEFAQNQVNAELIPRMVALGYPADLANYTYRYDLFCNQELEQEKKMEEAANQKFDRIIKLAPYFDIPAGFIEREFGIPAIQKVKTVSNQNRKKVLSEKKKPITTGAVEIENNFFEDLLSKFLLVSLDIASKLFKGTKLGDISLDSLSNLTAGNFNAAMEQNITYNAIDQKLLQALRGNIFYFSAAKSYSQLLEMQKLLIVQGERVSFRKFKESVKKLNDTFNKTYLETEYYFAVASAQIVSRWEELTAGNPDALLTYDAVGDGLTTELCNQLNGTTLPASDSFWDTYTPPNHWNCRSTIRQGDEEKPAPIGVEVANEFAFNPAKDKAIFSAQQSYFNNIPDYTLNMLSTGQGDKQEVLFDEAKFQKILSDKFEGLDLFELNKSFSQTFQGAEWTSKQALLAEDGSKLTLSYIGKLKESKIEVLRNIYRDDKGTLIAEHSQFSLGKNIRAKGYAKNVLGSFYEQYKNMGVDKIILQATGENGSYVWAKYGFYASDESQVRRIVKNAANNKAIPKKEVSLLGKFIDNFYKNTPDQPFPMNIIYKFKNSRKILSEQNWEGILDLKNERHLETFKKEIYEKNG